MFGEFHTVSSYLDTLLAPSVALHADLKHNHNSDENHFIG